MCSFFFFFSNKGDKEIVGTRSNYKRVPIICDQNNNIITRIRLSEAYLNGVNKRKEV